MHVLFTQFHGHKQCILSIKTLNNCILKNWGMEFPNEGFQSALNSLLDIEICNTFGQFPPKKLTVIKESKNSAAEIYKTFTKWMGDTEK